MLTARHNILTGGSDLPLGVFGQSYRIKPATEGWELRGYASLRRQTFCDEQQLFDGSDHDEYDVLATPIVAVSYTPLCDDEVIGCVRIFPTEDPDTWYGSRLSVTPEWRGAATLVAGLIRAAVCTAHARGCRRFLANVQRQNRPLFRRLHWHVIEELLVRGHPHLLMRADLAHYPPRDLAVGPMFEPKRVAS